IRDRNVTGVQTCALPISGRSSPTSAWVGVGRKFRSRLRVGGMKVLRFLRGQPLALGVVAALTTALVLTVLGHSTAVSFLAIGAIGVVIAVTAWHMAKDLLAGHW